MIIDPFHSADIEPFLKLAATENWVAESWEFEFLLSEFSRGCFAARTESGEAAGFVTSLRHDRSGWIGNLIVASQYRGRGVGEALFRKVLETLFASGVETVWLTASKAGMSLYQKHGFTRIDTIIRWNGRGRQRLAGNEEGNNGDQIDPVLSDIDSRGWGDRRSALMAATAGRGRLLRRDSGFVVVQPSGNARQLGPFSAPAFSTADALLKAALNTIPFGSSVSLDAPASNRTALLLFNRNRMRISGSNELMYSGVRPGYQPEYIYGLATMGSCG